MGFFASTLFKLEGEELLVLGKDDPSAGDWGVGNFDPCVFVFFWCSTTASQSLQSVSKSAAIKSQMAC